VPSKHIKVNKQENGSFSFDVLPIPDDLSKQEGSIFAGKLQKIVDLKYQNKDFWGYYDEDFTNIEIAQFKSEWHVSGPNPSNMFLIDNRPK